jgi:hypothetical protein
MMSLIYLLESGRVTFIMLVEQLFDKPTPAPINFALLFQLLSIFHRLYLDDLQ